RPPSRLPRPSGWQARILRGRSGASGSDGTGAAASATRRGAVIMRRLLMFMALSLGAAACQTVDTTQPGVVGVDRAQRMLVSSEEINAAAEQAYEKVIAEAKQANALDRDRQQVARVQRILKRLVPATAAF